MIFFRHKLDLQSEKSSVISVDRIPGYNSIKVIDPSKMAHVQKTENGHLGQKFQYESLDCSPKRRTDTTYPSLFATVPRVNLSFSPEENCKTPRSQFHTLSRTHFLRDLEPLPPLHAPRKEWMWNREARSSHEEEERNEENFNLPDFPVSDDTPPLLKKSAI